jgi:hypothetical protein
MHPVVLSVTLPEDHPVQEKPDDFAAPLPWETTAVDLTDNWYTAEPIPAASLEVHHVVDMAALGVSLPPRADVEREVHQRRAARDSRFLRAIPSTWAVVCTLAQHADPATRSHRWRGVAGAGIRLIEAGAGADPAVVFAFAVLHDFGGRALELERDLAASGLLLLDDDQRATLARALDARELCEKADEPTIGVCLDADRLIPPRRLGALSTPQASTVTNIPAQRDTNWRWIHYRFLLA